MKGSSLFSGKPLLFSSRLIGCGESQQKKVLVLTSALVAWAEQICYKRKGNFVAVEDRRYYHLR